MHTQFQLLKMAELFSLVSSTAAVVGNLRVCVRGGREDGDPQGIFMDLPRPTEDGERGPTSLSVALTPVVLEAATGEGRAPCWSHVHRHDNLVAS